MSDISLLKAASDLARHATTRHAVIARNIANADSPDYKAKDIKAFSLDDSEFELRTTRAEHLSAVGTTRGGRHMEYAIDAPVEPNGNSVSLEDQMVRAVQTQGQHNRALAIYQKSMSLLRMVASGR